MNKNTQVNQTDEANELPNDYYDQLRWSTDDLFELGVGVIPSADRIVTRNEYNGYDEFDELRDTQHDEPTDPDTFGLRGGMRYVVSGLLMGQYCMATFR